MEQEENKPEASAGASEATEDENENVEDVGDEKAESADGQDKAKDDQQGGKVDYKAELDKYKRLAEDRQKALERISKAKERKAQESDDSADGKDEIDLDKKLDDRVTSLKRELYADYVEDALDELTESEDERALVKTLYEERISNKGFSKKQVLADIQDAKLLANRAKYETDIRKKTEAQVKKALAEDKSMKGTGAASGSRKPPESQSNLSSEERSFLDSIKDYKARNGLK